MGTRFAYSYVWQIYTGWIVPSDRPLCLRPPLLLLRTAQLFLFSAYVNENRLGDRTGNRDALMFLDHQRVPHGEHISSGNHGDVCHSPAVSALRRPTSFPRVIQVISCMAFAIGTRNQLPKCHAI